MLHKPEISIDLSLSKRNPSLTLIWFSVNVPVLSVHMNVHEPKVSTEDNLLTIALDLAIFCIPMAKVNVKTAGNPSGIAATARETAVMNPSIMSKSWKKSIKNTPIQTAIDNAPIFFPIESTFLASGVSSSSS